MSADELRLKVDEFTFDHPLIKIDPAPPEWFVPAELGPWKIRDRDETRCSIVYDGRTFSHYPVSVVVPFRWDESPESTERLKRCLLSIAQAFPRSGECEILLTVDHASSASISRDILPPEISESAVISVPRFCADDDWRAGFVRNVGASFASTNESSKCASESQFLFIDADAAIAEPIPFRRDISTQNADLWMLADGEADLGFQNATTMLLAVRRSLFAELNGFSNAFSAYGCEDNFFVWQAVEHGARLGEIAKRRVSHLRPALETDDLIIKLDRLRTSADLMYRMTLDPAVHHHFFVSLGKDVWVRGALKRLMQNPFSRVVLAPVVFLLTLFETESPLTYLKSFYDIGIWKLKRPVLWLAGNKWRAGSFRHLWKAHAWKFPTYLTRLRGQIAGIAGDLVGFGIRAVGNFKRFMTPIPPRIIGRVGAVAGKIDGSRQRFQGNLKKYFVVAAREPTIQVAKNLKWKIAVCSVRLRGFIIKNYVNYLKVPIQRHVTSNLWRIPTLLKRTQGEILRSLVVRYSTVERIVSETWIFREPSAWFALRLPGFYKWVWRPLLKARYFLEYHLFRRWKSS